MTPAFGPDFFSANRARLRQAIGDDRLVVITGNGVMQRGGDEPSRFYQDSSFWYLTGLNGVDLTLVLDGADAYVLVPALSSVRQAFDGAHDVAAYAARSGITDFVDERAGWQRIRAALARSHAVATLLSQPEFMKHHGVYSLPYRRRLVARLRRLDQRLDIRDIRPELARLRVIKQPEELQALQQAIDITCETLQEVAAPAVLSSARHEYELEAAITYGFRRRGADGHAFTPIVGAGQHSTTLHYLANNGPVGSSDLVVLDVGAEVEHYAADITRTVSRQPLSGRQADVFNAVLAVQDYALEQIRPGVLPAEYEHTVETFMSEQLRRLGLIQGGERADIRRYFPHATSHFLGLDTHDVGDYRAPWQPDMVITCEPGIYIPEEGFGVRIEDDVLIIAGGHHVLSHACPRQLTPVQ